MATVLGSADLEHSVITRRSAGPRGSEMGLFRVEKVSVVFRLGDVKATLLS